jgi:protein involved in polysaccharide export with SLBB domain
MENIERMTKAIDKAGGLNADLFCNKRRNVFLACRKSQWSQNLPKRLARNEELKPT